MDISNLYIHQQDMIITALNHIESGKKHISMAMPPGSGKTAVVSSIIHEYLTLNASRKPLRVLVITRNKDTQLGTADVLKQTDISLDIQLDVKSDVSPNTEIIILSLFGLSKREKVDTLKDSDRNVDLIAVLGCGLSTPTLEELYEQYPEAIKLVITDLPETNTRFGTPLSVYTLKSAIDDGFLFKPYQVTQIRGLPIGLDEDLFSIGDGALSHKALRRQIASSQAHMEEAAKLLLAEIKEQKTIVYCPNVLFAEKFAEILNRQLGLYSFALAISNSMLVEARAQTIRSYKNSIDEPLVLCMTTPLVDDLELPLTRIIAIMRKTESVSLLQNMLISGLRPFPGKKQLQVLDFVGLEHLFNILDDQEVLVGRTQNPIEQLPPLSDRSEPVLPGQEYFKRANISFRDKKDIEGVLGVDELAEELAEIISIMPPEQGSMIGVFGKWGRGKTFLLGQTWKKLDKKDNLNKFIKVDFHTWKYQDTPATWAYLYECISDVYLNPKFKWKVSNWLVRAKRLFMLNLDRKGVWPILKFLAILSAGMFIYILGKELFSFISAKFQPAFSYAGVAFAGSATIYTLYVTIKKEYSAKAKDLFLKYSSKHSFKEHLGLQAEIQKETLTLLKVWIPEKDLKKRKIVLFVEDIDRCNEEKIIQIIDSLRVLLEDPEIAERVIVVAAVDESMLKLAIKKKYHPIMAMEKKETELTKALNRVTNEYIDKLFIAGLKLGNLSANDADEFLVALTKPDRENEQVSNIKELLNSVNIEMNSRIIPFDQDLMIDYQAEQRQMEELYDEGPQIVTEYLENSILLHVNPQLNTVNQRSNDEISRKLTNDEIDILRVTITNYKGATPRQIRIFYYRYLIAKNLLIKRYATLKRTNVWQTKLNCKTLAILIVLYTQNEEEDILNGHLEQSLNNTQEQQPVFLLLDTKVNGLDYQELLKVLSIVIAY